MPLRTPHISNSKIETLINKIQEGVYRIPRFQRDYVWDIDKAALLLDSIIHGFPIGSLIFWETPFQLSEQRSIGGRIFKTTSNYASYNYIIDGQQRITSLLLSLIPDNTAQSIDYSSLVIELSNDPHVFKAIPEGQSTDCFISASKLYSKQYYEDLPSNLISIAAELHSILHSYELPTVSIDKQFELSEVVDIFERLNICGKPLSFFSIIAAKTYEPSTDTSEGFDLEKKLNSINQTYAPHFGTISEPSFLKTISICLFGHWNKSEILLKLDSTLLKTYFTQIEKALEKAILFLQNTLGVKSTKLLPYEPFLSLYTYYFYKSHYEMDSQQKAYLIDFFWRNTVSERYKSQSDSKLSADVSIIESILKKEVPYQEKIYFSPKIIIEKGDFNSSSAFARGFLCLLASNNPKSLSPGKTILVDRNIFSKSAAKQYHHFFPSKSPCVLENPGFKTNNIVNIVLMDAETNNEISNKNPSTYYKEYKEINTDLANTLASHFIIDMDSVIQTNNYSEFELLRSRHLYNAIIDRLVNSETTVKDPDPAALLSAVEIRSLHLTAGKIVHDHISKLLSSGRVPSDEINRLTSLKECKAMFSHTEDPHKLSYSILVEKPKDKSMKDVGMKANHWRYCPDVLISTNSKQYMISSQVYAENIDALLDWYEKYR